MNDELTIQCPHGFLLAMQEHLEAAESEKYLGFLQNWTEREGSVEVPLHLLEGILAEIEKAGVWWHGVASKF